MNSEELELSLRNEFESYLKNIFAEMRQEVSDFQDKFQTEFEKHKSQLDDVFKDFSARIENDRELDAAFKDSVVEHLRLSRDEGARITASAIAEAEDLDKQNFASSVPAVGFSEIRDAISDISSQDSQSAILKSLVNHAAQFTARGAFFIIKNEHFVGWRVFGNEAEMDEETVREIFFPMANETLLSESVRSLSAVESSYGTYADDSLYLNKLEFGQPERMYAIPLVARGRGVAVLYADYGTKGADVNVEAIETLVRVAGLTVELLAASQTPKSPAKEETPNAYSAAESVEYTQAETTPNYQAVGGYDYSQPQEAKYETGEEIPQENTAEFVAQADLKSNPYAEFEEVVAEPEVETNLEEFEYKAVEDDVQPEIHEVEEVSAQVEEQPEAAQNYEFVSEQETNEVAETTEVEEKEAEPAYSWSQPIDSFESYKQPTMETQEQEEKTFAATEMTAKQTDDFAPVPATEYTFESTQNYNSEPDNFESTSSFSSEPVSFEDAAPVAETTQPAQWESNSYQEQNYDSSRFETAETPVETQFESFAAASPAEMVSEPVSAPPAKSRFSERNVDLPIEVPEDERRSHNDARRFARLLVSEIKLYNEQKVKEGRSGNDLYDRLREAIDRSREMYDKRVQPPVASKFDYFHYELVSNLAEGDSNKLGANYPGANV